MRSIILSSLYYFFVVWLLSHHGLLSKRGCEATTLTTSRNLRCCCGHHGTTSSSILAFAGGFGGSSSSRNKVGTKKKREKGKKRKGGLSEFPSEPASPTLPNNSLEEIRGGDNVGMSTAFIDKKEKEDGQEDTTSQPRLDKWGLPIATIDDIFPPMPEGTELIPCDPSKEGGEYSLQDIQQCLDGHIDLKLDKFFDQNGISKQSNDGNGDGDENESVPAMKLRLLHKSPPVLAIDNFFTESECVKIREATESAYKVGSATFAGALSTRTSTSWFCHYTDVPILLAKANHILNIDLETMEEPQIVRYRTGQEFSWHYDEVPSPQLKNGGQRLATLLVYLNDISPTCGGGTTFRDLYDGRSGGRSLVMQPKLGSALLFFPAFADGRPDDRTLHKSEVMTCHDDEKWIVQMWIHQSSYQAVLPPGNSHEAARKSVLQTLQALNYSSM